MGLSQEQQIFVSHVARLILFANSKGVMLTFGEAYRTKEQQEIHVKNGASKTMLSKHLDRLAIDFNFFINGQLVYEKEKLTEIGAYWESLDIKNRWGGNFKSILDVPHFERNV